MEPPASGDARVHAAGEPVTGKSTSAQKHASGSSFYWALRLLPRAQREAMFEVYGFCRLVDDIADASGPRERRMAQLEQWRADIAGMYAGKTAPRVAVLAQAAREFQLAREDFLAVIDGMEMDVAADMRAPSLRELYVYCDRVASAVGRLSVRVFGMERQVGLALSHHLGRALQLTNILRDLDKDAEIGRLYLPREYLDAAGIEGSDPATVLASPHLTQACNRMVSEARDHFTEAEQLMRCAPRQTVRASKMMAAVYRAKLDQMVERGWLAPRAEVSTGRLALAWIVLRSLAT